MNSIVIVFMVIILELLHFNIFNTFFFHLVYVRNLFNKLFDCIHVKCKPHRV